MNLCYLNTSSINKNCIDHCDTIHIRTMISMTYLCFCSGWYPLYVVIVSITMFCLMISNVFNILILTNLIFALSDYNTLLMLFQLKFIRTTFSLPLLVYRWVLCIVANKTIWTSWALLLLFIDIYIQTCYETKVQNVFAIKIIIQVSF